MLHKEHRLNLHRATSVLQKQVEGSSRLLREDVCRALDTAEKFTRSLQQIPIIRALASPEYQALFVLSEMTFYTFKEDRLMKHRAAKERRLAFKQEKITGILSMKVVFIYIFSMKVSFLFSFLFILFPFQFSVTVLGVERSCDEGQISESKAGLLFCIVVHYNLFLQH